ncbi:MaoC/PaaZ C-terminal domain-containing protein [Glaciibacter psychrotolerans]|uniref:Acyl dehydratase n=1 Tax=Glaciibacter psychrotolerans TaxID=670054 RepID=A0A7Z0J6Q7_9MICO|nr:MaoC/PaaZ C-terminal domain-containing protein [Leifsonia psychrotolerans]NYJ20451.1 acyl dehydratase [Leifsonia psychrotolerans]
MIAGEWAGRSLGERSVAYDNRDVILYALAVGATRDDLDLVFEDRLRVLPTFGLTLAQWAPDVLSDAGAFDHRSVHGSQVLDVQAPMPREGEILLAARVGNVWDKGTAAVFEVVVESDYFTATWAIFAPGAGGYGGERGPRAASAERAGEPRRLSLQTVPTQAALYRLTGDRHHIHIDPEASALIGQPIPILQGLCTISATTLPIAAALGAHPADLTHLAGRFAGPVVPGDTLDVDLWEGGAFEAKHGDDIVISAGEVVFE